LTQRAPAARPRAARAQESPYRGPRRGAPRRYNPRSASARRGPPGPWRVLVLAGDRHGPLDVLPVGPRRRSAAEHLGSQGSRRPAPAMHRVRYGTCSWSEKSWVGAFYPPGTRPGDYLRHYAEHFDTVEADSSYYARPSASMVRGWYD